MKTIIGLILIFLTGCGTVQYTDADYGGKLNRLAYEGYQEFHDQRITTLKTGLLYNDRTGQATGTCVEHTVWAATRINEPYEIILLKVTDGLWHSVVKVNDQVLDINFGEPRPYSEYADHYMAVKNYRQVKPQDIKPLLSALGYAF